MPEGDTIHTLARELGRELDGQPLAELRVQRHGRRDELVGETLGRVYARGKHLLVPIGQRVVLRVHLGMYGGWDRFRVHGRWRVRTARHEVLIRTEVVAFACRRPSAAELVRAREVEHHPTLSRLGPDLISDDVDWDQVVRRARDRAVAPVRVGDLLLDQTVAAGIGNIFKAEALFCSRIRPDTDVRALSDAELRELYQCAARLLRANVSAVPRVLTAPDPSARRRPDAGRSAGRTWVYGRKGRPCRVCAQPIRFVDEGGDERMSWWCPSCQT